MTRPSIYTEPSPARCLIVRHSKKADKRWHLSDRNSHTLLADPDLWAVLRRAYGLGFEHSTISDNGSLYYITLVGIE